MALARARHIRSWEGWALKVLGDIHAHDHVDAEGAANAYRQALALATELGMRPLVAHCHFGLAKFYRQSNQREQARENLTTATSMYREMGMQFWLGQAKMEMRALV